MSFPRYPKYKDSGVEWLGEVPADWSVTPLKYVVRLRSGGTPSKTNLAYWDGDVPWASSKDLKTEVLSDTQDHIAQQAIDEGAADLVPVGSILIVVRGMILAHTFPVVKALVPMAINQDVKALTPAPRLKVDFLAWLLRGASRETLGRIDEAGHGTKVLRLEAWTSMPLPLPPLQVQDQIAAFLDSETAQLDALVAEQRRLMELLREKRQAVISQAVTKGLNPNAPMKDSGIEWLGEVPAHWGVLPLRRCLIEHRQGYYSTDPYVDTGVKLLRITDLRSFGRICFDECPQVEARAELEPFLLQNADFVFARTGGAGLFGLVEMLAEPVSYASYLIRFRFDTKTHPGFLRQYFLSSGFQNAVKQNIHGGVNQNIHAEDIKNQYLALPPDVEQRLIADFLDAETAKFDALTAEAQRAVDLLQERRTALISAAVTGQIDVRQLSKGKAA